MPTTTTNGQRSTSTKSSTKQKNTISDLAFAIAPSAQLMVDAGGVIVACNDSAVGLLTGISDYVPVDATELVGEPIETLSFINIDEAAVTTSEDFGDVTLEIAVAPIGAGNGHLISLATVNPAPLAPLHQAMVECAPINMMFADNDLVLQYMNDASLETLRSIEDDLPVKVDEIEGSFIDIFHQHPEHQRALLADPANLPHRANIKVGENYLELLVTALHDDQGEHIGAMATWEVVTGRLSILAAIEKIATGDLTTQIDFTGEGIFDQMATALDKMVKNFRHSVTNIAATSTGLEASGDQMSQVSMTMGANAEEVSAQAGVVAAAAEEVSANVSTVAAASEEMSASIKEIASSSSSAASVAGQAVDVARETSQTATQLGESSNEIGQIIKVITSIAQQTNLLALNASIEAARAGEAGKGFAVVANEVKDLAKETARATEEISKKIETIQGDTTTVVDSIARISEIIDQISDIQTTIAGAVEEQAATTSEIGRNVTEAARGSSEIAENITSVAESAQSTTAGAAKTSQSADTLSMMAGELRELVSAFNF